PHPLAVLRMTELLSLPEDGLLALRYTTPAAAPPGQPELLPSMVRPEMLTGPASCTRICAKIGYELTGPVPFCSNTPGTFRITAWLVPLAMPSSVSGALGYLFVIGARADLNGGSGRNSVDCGLNRRIILQVGFAGANLNRLGGRFRDAPP